MTSNERKNLVKIGASTLRSGKGYRTFLAGSMMASAITFLAFLGAMTIAMAMMLNDYGIGRALAEMHAISGTDAVLALRGLLFNPKHLVELALASAFVGSLVGLKDVGLKELHAKDSVL